MKTRLVRLSISLAAVTALLPVVSASAAPTPRVAYSELQTQLAAHQVTHATINKKAHDVRIILKDGKRELVIYPSHQEPQLLAQLSAAGATYKVRKARKVKAAGHHLRYIAAGILVVIVLIGGAVYLVGRRRQQEAAGTTAASPASGSAPPPPAPRPPSATADEGSASRAAAPPPGGEPPA